MKNLIILLTLLMTACSATGPAYTGHEKGNLVVYRPSRTLAPFATAPIFVNSERCDLVNDGFFVTNITKETEITSHQWATPGTSRITVGPNSFVRVEINSGRAVATMTGGALGNIMYEQVNGGGQYNLIKVSKDVAEKELQGLHQDCI